MNIASQRADFGLFRTMMIVLGIIVSIIVGILSSASPLIVIVLVVAIIVAVLSFIYPNVATQAFVFLLYTNAAVVANKFHDVPFIITAGFPLFLAIPFFYLLFFRREKIIVTRIFLMILGLLLVQVFGTLLSIDISNAFENLLTFLIEAAAIYFLVTNVIRSRESLRHVMMLVFFATIFMAFFPTLQFLTGTEENNYGGFAIIEEEPGFTTSETLIGETTQLRYSGAIGEKNRFAQTMLMLMVLALPHLWQSKERYWRLLALVTVALSGIASILAFSRGGGVGLVITFAIVVLLRLISTRQILTILIGASLILLIFPQYTMRMMSLSSVGAMFGIQPETAEEPDGAIEGRMTEMLAALIVYAEHPVFGVGPEMFKYYAADVGNQLGIRRLDGERREHSLYLDILANTGTLGMLLYAGIIFTLIQQLLKVHHRWKDKDAFMSATALGFIFAIITYLTTGIFLHFAFIRYFWTTIALASIVVIVADRLNLEMSSRQKINGESLSA